MDHQHPAGKARPLQSGNRSLGLGSMGHRDEAKAWRLAGLPILENIAASHYSIGCEQAFPVHRRNFVRQTRIAFVNDHLQIAPQLIVVSTPPLKKTFEHMRGPPTLLG